MTRYHTGPRKMVYNDSFYTFNYRAYNMLYVGLARQYWPKIEKFFPTVIRNLKKAIGR